MRLSAYKLKSSAANSKNSVISAVGEAIGAAQESMTGTYEYLANNVTNDFIPSLMQGYIDMNTYPGDEQYVLITANHFPSQVQRRCMLTRAERARRQLRTDLRKRSSAIA